MTKSQSNFTWLEQIYQPQNFQATIFTGFDFSKLNPMTIIINDFINSMDFSFFEQYYKSNEMIGGRPPYEYTTLLKIYMYSLYNDISIRTLHEFYVTGSNLHFLVQEFGSLPNRKIFSHFLKILDNHIDEIFDLSLGYICKFITLDLSNLYCDGTIFEAHNNRHKIVTDTNVERSKQKWESIMNNPDSKEELKELAKKKLELNIQRSQKLKDLNRTSYGRTDEDCVILKDKNGAFIAGYNVQFIEEGKYGLIVYSYISNKNPDSNAFLDIIEPLILKYHPKNIILDTGYGTPEIILKLQRLNVNVIVKALKIENSKKKINDYSFELSDGEDYLICPVGQILEKDKIRNDGNVLFKATNCDSCEIKNACFKKGKSKRVTINLEEFKAMKLVDRYVNSESGKESYSHRGNMCESPHGFIKYNLNGKKLKMNGLTRNNTIVILYSILYNLRRLISIKIDMEENH